MHVVVARFQNSSPQVKYTGQKIRLSPPPPRGLRVSLLTSSFRKALKFLVTLFGSAPSLPLTTGSVFSRSNASSE